MPEQAHHQPHQQGPEAPASPENAEQHFKTIAVRVEEGLHAQLRFLAQLNETSISEEIRTAIEHRLTTAQDDPAVVAKAEAARAEVEREAAARTAAIAGFIGKPVVSDTTGRRQPRTAKAAAENQTTTGEARS